MTDHSFEPFRGKTLVITGGTGTFGNAVYRRFAGAGLREIRVFSRDETKQDDMRRRYVDPTLRFYLGDVRERTSLDAVMAGADFVFHAAALKQVPSCEFFPLEAVRTNILGAEHVLAAAVAHRVKRVIVLSTDKAAYPINAMGMSKALMEKLAIAQSRVAAEQGTIVCATRYGNVMASRGSVIPLFIEQILDGRPLTVTEPSMTRFMMSIEDAVNLVVFAFTHGQPGDLFVQKAPAATIGDLSLAMQRIFGMTTPVRLIGMRHGEKIFETLLTREEMARAEDLGSYFRVPADARGLNYESFFSEGTTNAVSLEDYHSHNTTRLDGDSVEALLRTLPEVKAALESRVVPAGNTA